MPFLGDLESVQAAPSTPENFLAKMQVKDLIPQVEAVLFPKDDDG